MNTYEMSGVAFDNNEKFKNDFASFGIEDQKIIDEISGYGKIAGIKVFDDSLEVFFKTGKHGKIVVRKSELRKIDPQNKEVIKKEMVFMIDKNPEKKYVKSASRKKPSGEQYEQDSAMWG